MYSHICIDLIQVTQPSASLLGDLPIGCMHTGDTTKSCCQHMEFLVPKLLLLPLMGASNMKQMFKACTYYFASLSLSLYIYMYITLK